MKASDVCFGMCPSQLDGTEYEYEASNIDIPEEYSYMGFLSPVVNQGKTNTCVCQSISAHMNWNKNVDDNADNNRDIHFNIQELYGQRDTPGDNGMTFKCALHYLYKHGVSSACGKVKIQQYAMVRGIQALKEALIMNGPCVGGFIVYNMSPYFWDPKIFENNYGGHAISIVGYNKEGFIIRNSWGTEWGFAGYTLCPYKDFEKLLEVWTIID